MTGIIRSRRVGARLPQVRRDLPMYARMLRLRHIAPSGFLCFVYLEGSVGLGILLALAELVSWWGVLVLPAVVALMVKLNDIVAGLLARQTAASQDPASTPRPAFGRANQGAPASVPPPNLEAGPPTSHGWADQIARQSAARRY